MKKAIEIGMAGIGLMAIISALSKAHNAEVCKTASERYVEGFDTGEYYGFVKGRAATLNELLKDNVIDGKTAEKYVDRIVYKR